MSIRFLSGVRSIPPGMEDQFLSERNSYNAQQMRLAVLFILPVCLFLIIRFFLPGENGPRSSLLYAYPAVYGGLILEGLVFLLCLSRLRKKLTLSRAHRLQMGFIVLFSLLLMVIAVLEVVIQRELYAYLILLLFLSVVVWLSRRTFTILSLMTLTAVLVPILAADPGQGSLFADRLIQILIYFAIGWFLYFSLTSLLMENFFNRISLEEQYQQLATESITDPLTGLYNKRSLQEDLKKEWATSLRKKTPFCVIMVDIDELKGINEAYGHTAGDHLIRELAVMIRNAVRLSDKVYRYGGEEFLILMTESSLSITATVAERIRQSIEKNSFPGIRKTVTVSMGIAQSEEDINTDILINRADQKLRLAKENGRNRVEQ